MTSTRVPGLSPSAEAMPEEVVAAAGGAADVEPGATGDEVVGVAAVVVDSGAGAAA